MVFSALYAICLPISPVQVLDGYKEWIFSCCMVKKKMDLTEQCEVGQISRCLHFSLTCLFLSHPSPKYYKPSSFTSTPFEFQNYILEQRACTVCFDLKKMQENTWIMFSFRCTHLIEWSIKWLLQFPCLKNPMDREVRPSVLLGVA